MKKERGFTIVELVMAIAAAGLIVSFLGTAIHQIVTVTEYGNDKLAANHELQNIAHWVSVDGQMAKAASGGDELELTLTDNSLITYSLVGTELRRAAGGSNMTLAQNIASANFSIESRTITMTVTSSPEGRDNVSEQGTYKVYLRPAGGEGGE